MVDLDLSQQKFRSILFTEFRVYDSISTESGCQFILVAQQQFRDEYIAICDIA